MKTILEQYLESDINDFDEFLETIISSDISPENRPEQPSKEDEDEQEEECGNKKKSKK